MIKDVFSKGKAFIAFVTAGDPSLEVTEQLVYAMEEAGADLIELGIPFSDPMAEGVVIQAANERALKAGCTTDQVFALVERIRRKSKIPLVFLTYLNPVVHYGAEKFMEQCEKVGIDGLIIPDMPYEEKGELAEVCRAHHVDIISMIAPTSQERTVQIAKDATGFLYCVSSLGVTGVRTEIKTNIAEMVQLIRQATELPCAVGFGISTPEQARQMAEVADGAIVGSAIVKLVGQYGTACVPYVKEYVSRMKAAVSSIGTP